MQTYNDTWTERSYIRLLGGEIPASYSTIKLYLRVQGPNNATGDPVRISQAAATWGEGTITWNNQPNGLAAVPTGDLLASFDFLVDTVIYGGWTYHAITLPLATGLEEGVIIWNPEGSSFWEMTFWSSEADDLFFRFNES